jgi:hypothetical protein
MRKSVVNVCDGATHIHSNTRMKTKPNLLQAIITGALLAVAGCATPSHPTAAWEYRVVEGWTREPQRAEFEKQLNEAGREGYVIVSSTTLPGDANNASKTTVILKRRKQ